MIEILKYMIAMFLAILVIGIPIALGLLVIIRICVFINQFNRNYI